MNVYYCNNAGIQQDFSGLTVSPPKFAGGPSMVSMKPQSNGPRTRDLRVLLGREFGGVVPTKASLSMTNTGRPILVNGTGDVGAIVFVYCAYWKHRNGVAPVTSPGNPVARPESWGKIVGWEGGYGAWGYGYVALVVLTPGQWHFSSTAGGQRLGITLATNNVLSCSYWPDEQYEELVGGGVSP